MVETTERHDYIKWIHRNCGKWNRELKKKNHTEEMIPQCLICDRVYFNGKWDYRPIPSGYRPSSTYCWEHNPLRERMGR